MHCLIQFQRIAAIAVLIPIVASANWLYADILVSNLDQPYRATTPIGNPEFWAGQSFIFATPDAVNLDSIQVLAGDGTGSPAVVAELRTSIAGEIDNTPAGLVAVFNAPDLTGPSAIRTFLPTSLVTLDPSTQYWFILGSANGGTFGWDYANTPLTSGYGVLQNYSDSSDGGVTWILRDDAFPYFMQVNTSAVPEPGSGILLLGCLLTANFLRRRRAQNS